MERIMKRFKEHLTEAKTKPVVFTFGRFNPITKGHAKLIDFVVKKSKGGTGMVFASQSQDTKKNPLDYNQKIKYLKKFFPKATIVKNTSLRTPFEILKWLSDEGYKDVTMVVGGDRVDEFDKQIRKYVKHTDPTKSYDFDKFDVLNAGARKAGDSGTDMRQHVQNDDLKSFLKGLPKHVSSKDGEIFFNDVKKGLGINEYLEFGKKETTKEYKKKTPGEANEDRNIINNNDMKTFKAFIIEKKKYKSQMSKKEKYKTSKDYLMLKTQQSKLGKIPSKYKERKGLEGPFMTISGQVVYYDKKFGAYYNSDTDIYIEYDDWKKMSDTHSGPWNKRYEEIEEMNFDRMLGLKGASKRSRPSGKKSKLKVSDRNAVHNIAKKYKGNLERALKDIEKLGKGLAGDPAVLDIVRHYNGNA